MKSKTKLFLSLITLVINLALLGISTFFLILNQEDNNGGGNGGNNAGIPIFIDGNGTNNWNWASTQPWCQGSGTSEDPYIIENLILDANGSESCIRIRDSSVRVIIMNCTLFNASYAGIDLFNVDYCDIFENAIYNNFEGIRMEYCEHNYVLGNVIYNNENGILIERSNYHNISYNNLFGNYISGINASRSYSNCFHRNNMSLNMFGISQKLCNYTVIYDSVIYNNIAGLFLDYETNSQISDNYLNNNSVWGFSLRYSSHNLIFNNDFIENGINAIDELGTNNQWYFAYDNTGNFWSDYSGVDADDNGIGDTPYDVPPAGGSMDYYPIWDDGPG
ncbi:MAG: nitrous oxide reductase family maturation protein NosD [Promethearchaeota archaeon]